MFVSGIIILIAGLLIIDLLLFVRILFASSISTLYELSKSSLIYFSLTGRIIMFYLQNQMSFPLLWLREVFTLPWILLFWAIFASCVIANEKGDERFIDLMKFVGALLLFQMSLFFLLFTLAATQITVAPYLFALKIVIVIVIIGYFIWIGYSSNYIMKLKS